MKVIKLTNGSVSYLVGSDNKNKIVDLCERGFEPTGVEEVVAKNAFEAYRGASDVESRISKVKELLGDDADGIK